MANNYLNVSRQDPFQSLIQGFTAGQSIMGNISQQNAQNIKNQMLQREMDKQQAVSSALSNYGQPGYDEAAAVKAVMPHDPELGIKIANLKRQSTKEQLELYGLLAKIGHEVAPSLIDNPQGYYSFQQKMESMGMGNMIPHIGSFINPETKQVDIAKMNESVKRIAAGSQLFLEEAKAGLKPPDTRTIEQGENKITQQWNPQNKQYDTIGQGPRWDPNKQRTRMELADGTIVDIGPSNAVGQSSGLAKTTQGKIEDGLLNATNTRMLLSDLQMKMQPGFQTYGSKLSNMWGGLKAKVDPSMLSDEERKGISAFADHKAAASELLSKVLSQLSGAAVSEHEAKRLEAFIPKPGDILSGDNPVEFAAKVERFKEMTDKSIARLNYLRKSGFSIQNSEDLKKHFSNMPLDKMDDMITKFKERRKAEYMKKGLNPQEAIKKSLQETADFFGLVN